MSAKLTCRRGCFVVAMTLLAWYAPSGWSQDKVPLESQPTKPGLIRELQGVPSPNPPGYRTDLINDLPSKHAVDEAAPREKKDSPSGVVVEILKLRAADPNAKRDPVEEAEFAEALQKLVEQKKRELEESQSQRPPQIMRIKPSDLPLVNQLRTSAQHMETVARQHEFAGDYEAADKAREAALQLWQEARHIAK